MSFHSYQERLFSLEGKVALITGGSRGLGFYAASAVLQAGAREVILVARKGKGPQGLDLAASSLSQLPGITGSIVTIEADISKTEEIKRVVDAVSKTHAAVDILIANAGATWGGPFEPTPDHSSIKVLDLNVRSVFNLIRLMVPLLARAGKDSDPSRVIIVGSVAGIGVPHVGDNGTIMYAASKAAAHHIARNLAVELGPRNITTNALAPGYFPSKLANGIIEILGGAEEISHSNPRKRLGISKDIEGAIIYLCSSAGSYVNGAIIPLDGGAHLTFGVNTKL